MNSCLSIAKLETCKFVKYYFLSIKFIHAILQFVCNISVNYLKDTLKAVIGVNFTKYALLQFIQYNALVEKLRQSSKC